MWIQNVLVTGSRVRARGSLQQVRVAMDLSNLMLLPIGRTSYRPSPRTFEGLSRSAPSLVGFGSLVPGFPPSTSLARPTMCGSRESQVAVGYKPVNRRDSSGTGRRTIKRYCMLPACWVGSERYSRGR